MTYPFVVPVNWFVSLGAPLGHTLPASVQLVRSFEVRIGIPVPVAARILLVRTPS